MLRSRLFQKNMANFFRIDGVYAILNIDKFSIISGSPGFRSIRYR